MRNPWHHPLLFPAYFLATVMAQESFSNNEEGKIDDDENSTYSINGRHILDPLVAQIIETSGERVWEGWDEEETQHTLGIPHEANRRALKRDTNNPQYFSIGSEYSTRKHGKKAVKVSKGSSKSSKSYKAKAPVSRPSYPTHPTRYPTPSPPTPSRPTHHPPNPMPTPPNGGGCKTRVDVDFLQFTAIPPALVNDPNNPDFQDPGTRYVYNDSLRDQDTIDELQGSRATGTCTRTQSRIGNPGIGLQLGSGHCVFTYTLFDGNREITFTAQGDLTDSIGGTLSITGGTKSVLGAYGEIELVPVNLLQDGSFEVETGDVFLDPLFYLAEAAIFVPC